MDWERHIPITVELLGGNKWVKLFDVTFKDREKNITYTMVVTNPSVVVLPWRKVNEQIEVMLLKVFRQAAGVCWEAINEGIKPEESSATAVYRGIAEEGGFPLSSVQGIEFIGYGFSEKDRLLEKDPVVGEKLEPKRKRIFLARINSIAELGCLKLDPEENIEILWFSLKNAFKTVTGEGMRSGFSANLAYLLSLLKIREMRGDI